MTFEAFWDDLQATLKPGDTIRNWTVKRNYREDDTFTIESLSNDLLVIDTPDAKKSPRVKKSDFRFMWDRWEPYCRGEISRSVLMVDSFTTRYTISIIKHLEYNPPKSEDNYDLSGFNAIPEQGLIEAYRNEEFDSFAERILKAMATFGGNGELVTRNLLKTEIGRKKGWSRIMVALAATGYIELVQKRGGLHYYRLLRNPFSQDDAGYDYTAKDIEAPDTRRVETTTYRVLRDTALARRIKMLHGNQCQICGLEIELPDGSRYSEAHHIKPLGNSHNGPDIEGNILVLCPNHHAMCDLGVIPLGLSELCIVKGHKIDPQFVEYHNSTLLVE